ncbi:MAG: VTT domain-containing protein [Bryobacteraceae bacterium]
MGQLIAIALATFVSEDLTCIATGALVAGGHLGLVEGVLACAAGIYFGDLLLYFTGRLAGRPIIRRLVPESKIASAARWMAERGAAVVLLSRFTPGLRLPTYLAAGMLHTRFWTFNLYFLAAALVWTPLLVGSAAVLGRGIPGAPLAVAVAVAGWQIARLRWQTRQRIIGWFRRRARWEFWPPWLAYLPIVPYLLYLGWRHRSLTLFTAANPGIPSGGFVGESKSSILSHLPRVPDFQLVRAGETLEVSEFPVVLKPDVGERGTGVVIARSREEVNAYLAAARIATIVQRYVGGLEFGVFYYRYPGERSGRICSITEKRFPEVVGDGVSKLSDLVLRDDRAVCLAHIYLARQPDRILFPGERVRLVELGSHCRGAIFLDGSSYCTPELEAAIDAVAQSHPGFYFGRFDLRTPSIADFQAGIFQVLELNGVSAEATHIYDPAVSLLEAYRVMFRLWRIAFEIGSANRAAGARPMTLRQFVQVVRAPGRTQRPGRINRHDHRLRPSRPADPPCRRTADVATG